MRTGAVDAGSRARRLRGGRWARTDGADFRDRRRARSVAVIQRKLISNQLTLAQETYGLRRFPGSRMNLGSGEGSKSGRFPRFWPRVQVSM